jgi:hypothetical protein
LLAAIGHVLAESVSLRPLFRRAPVEVLLAPLQDLLG